MSKVIADQMTAITNVRVFDGERAIPERNDIVDLHFPEWE